ncbi:Bardet-Biedl syndrome 1 protein [Trichogramma pretiosum]|uniref:Bardet-Biedl syndrome 1 protein n=1 Tax=Trichogramma pretiosum TaxID=7493 RepID=UPI0006C984D9|nr:Bardet-Biedl syndrome 1 protein [Trichogramma pretiosum]
MSKELEGKFFEFLHKPQIESNIFSSGIDFSDFDETGNCTIVIASSAPYSESYSKFHVLKNFKYVSEYLTNGSPCGIMSFITETHQNSSLALAVGTPCHLYIYKNMKPYFKFSLHPTSLQSTVNNLDHKFVEEDGITKNSVNDSTHIFLRDTAKESCTQLPDTGKLFSKKSFFISSSNKTHKIKKDVITCLNKVNKNSWSQNALSYLVIGTQQGEIYIVDSQSFFTIEKYKTSSALMAIEPLGQWLRGGLLVTACRNRKIGCFYRKKKFIMWERSISPVVVMSAINHTGVVVATMDKTISFFSKQGKKLWKFIVQSYVLDLMGFQMPQTGAFLFAFSMANFGIYVYDQKQQLDFMRVSDTVSCFKVKSICNNDIIMVMLAKNGNLHIKSLRELLKLFQSGSCNHQSYDNIEPKFLLTKKSQIYMEQTIKERSDPKLVYMIFQRSFLRLRLCASMSMKHVTSNMRKLQDRFCQLNVSFQGLGKKFMLNISAPLLKNTCQESLFIILRSENLITKKKIINLPTSILHLNVPFEFENDSKSSRKIQILLCKFNSINPVCSTDIVIGRE